MHMKAFWIAMGLSAVLSAGTARAAVVTMTDGSSLSGDIKEQDNGDVVVSTGAGEITVAKGKIRSIIKDSSSAAPINTGVDNSYIENVEKRRAKFGNQDGLPHTQNLQQDQLFVTAGQLNYTGDAFLVKDPSSGATLLSDSDLAGISYGLGYAHSYTDWVALEVWGDYSSVSKDYTVSGSSSNLSLQRFDIGIGPKVQKAIALGSPEQSLSLIPSIGLTPIWSSAMGSNGGTSFNSSSVGASFNVGLDFQFGGALIGLKYRYLVSSDVTGSLKSNNTSAGLPQLAVGFSF
jgi:hypothetical protein